MKHCGLSLRAGLIAVGILLIGCSGAERRCEYAPLMPLVVGNSWAYTICRVHSESGEQDCYKQDTLRVTGHDQLDGDEYYLTDFDRMAFRETSGGLSIVIYQYPHVSGPDFFLRYPIADGTVYEYSSAKIDQPRLLIRVDEEIIDVPAGRYRVLTYHAQSGSGMPFVTFSLAPGVGLVRITFPGEYQSTVYMLVSVNLVGAAPEAVQESGSICGPRWSLY